MNKYKLMNSENELIRIFDSHEEALKYITDGDYLVKIANCTVKLAPYDYAFKKVGECLL